MQSFKKPKDVKFLCNPVMTAFGEQNKTLSKNLKLNREVANALEEGFNVFFWVAQPSAGGLKDGMGEVLNQINFPINRILLKPGSEQYREWAEAHIGVAKAFVDFLIERREEVLEWTGSKDAEGAEAFFKA